MRHAICALAVIILLPSAVQAHAGIDPFEPAAPACSAIPVHPSPWAVTFGAPPDAPPLAGLRLAFAEGQATASRRPVPVEYSEAYKMRAKIHRIASFATLPLFVANYLVGQDLYNNPSDAESNAGLHGGLAATTGILFGVNSGIGVWNLWEGRKDPTHRGRRMTHGILMLAANVGFLATGMLAPDDDEGPPQNASDGRSTHRSVAITSMGIATVGYLMMLFWK